MSKKAKLVSTWYLKDKSRICVYEYRGYEYQITFNEYGVYNGIFLDVSGAHKDEQDRIDERIARESLPKEPYSYEKSAQSAIDAFYNYVETGEFKIKDNNS